jgi:hypothetical protein
MMVRRKREREEGENDNDDDEDATFTECCIRVCGPQFAVRIVHHYFPEVGGATRNTFCPPPKSLHSIIAFVSPRRVPTSLFF